MATLTSAEMADRVLENLGVKPAGQPAGADDKATATEAVASALSRLRYEGRAQFDFDAIPDWAWSPIRDFVSFELKDLFGISGERLQSLAEAHARAGQTLSTQSAGKHNPAIRAVARYY